MKWLSRIAAQIFGFLSFQSEKYVFLAHKGVSFLSTYFFYFTKKIFYFDSMNIFEFKFLCKTSGVSFFYKDASDRKCFWLDFDFIWGNQNNNILKVNEFNSEKVFVRFHYVFSQWVVFPKAIKAYRCIRRKQEWWFLLNKKSFVVLITFFYLFIFQVCVNISKVFAWILVYGDRLLKTSFSDTISLSKE